jgi:tRNA 2-selenouridine synthase
MPRRPDTDDYRALFLNPTPMMDMRAPTEFAHGAFPSALSLPLMSDEERALVGTCYKQRGQAAAIELGHQLVRGEVKAQRVAQWAAFARQHPQGYLYCFRGGLRSQTVQQWLREVGYRVPAGCRRLQGHAAVSAGGTGAVDCPGRIRAGQWQNRQRQDAGHFPPHARG